MGGRHVWECSRRWSVRLTEHVARLGLQLEERARERHDDAHVVLGVAERRAVRQRQEDAQRLDVRRRVAQVASQVALNRHKHLQAHATTSSGELQFYSGLIIKNKYMQQSML